MPNKPMAMAAPTGIQTVLSEMPDLFHICRQGNAIRATMAGRAPRRNALMAGWLHKSL